MSGVVLLHGWPGAPSDYDEVVARLGDAFGRVLVPDLFAPRDPDARSEAFARRVLEEMRQADMQRPVVVGYDIGARIGQALTRIAPQDVAGETPVTVPTRFLWPDQDPLFPVEWADALDDWFTDVARVVPGNPDVPDISRVYGGQRQARRRCRQARRLLK